MNKIKILFYTIALGIISSLTATYIYSSVKENSFLSTLRKFLNFEISLSIWLIFIILVIFFTGIYLLIKRFTKNEILSKTVVTKSEEKLETKALKLPEYSNYKSDRFKNLKYSWNYDFKNSYGKTNIVNLKVYCPKCDTPFLPTKALFGRVFLCPRCEYMLSELKILESRRVRALIIDNINRKNF